MATAITEAKIVLSAADNHAEKLAEILTGRLRKVSEYRLKQLKRELASFNAITGRWK